MKIIPLHRRGAGVGCPERRTHPRRLRLLPLPRGDFHRSLSCSGDRFRFLLFSASSFSLALLILSFVNRPARPPDPLKKIPCGLFLTPTGREPYSRPGKNSWT